jgi:dTDP-4-dehydrorhamnose reductase
MIYILGASGYIGQAFLREAQSRKLPALPVSRAKLDYTDFRTLRAALRRDRPLLVVNAAGFTGQPNVDACENQRAETLAGNVALAQTVAQACEVAGVRLGTVSSGCIYQGAKIQKKDGSWDVEDRLTEPLINELLEQKSPLVRGFQEDDDPNFCFEHANCSFYSGTKAAAEKILRGFPDFYIWRMRIPFDELDGARNYLSKVQRYPKVYQNWNSVSHRGDFVAACLESWIRGAPGGIYNVVNPGYLSTRQVVEKIARTIKPGWQPCFWRSDDEFYRFGAITPRSNCLLDTAKILGTGVVLRPVEQALEDALDRWKKQDATALGKDSSAIPGT